MANSNNTETINQLNEFIDLLDDRDLRNMLNYFWLHETKITRASVKGWIERHKNADFRSLDFADLQNFALTEFSEDETLSI